MVDPDYRVDIRHHGLKQPYGTGHDVTFSSASLAPGGPTLPPLEGGAYDVLTRQMHGYVHEELQGTGFITTDRYQVGGRPIRRYGRRFRTRPLPATARTTRASSRSRRSLPRRTTTAARSAAAISPTPCQVNS